MWNHIHFNRLLCSSHCNLFLPNCRTKQLYWTPHNLVLIYFEVLQGFDFSHLDMKHILVQKSSLYHYHLLSLVFFNTENTNFVPQNIHGLIGLGLQCRWHGYVHHVYGIIVSPLLIVKPLQMLIQIGKGGKGANTSLNTKSINEMSFKVSLSLLDLGNRTWVFIWKPIWFFFGFQFS